MTTWRLAEVVVGDSGGGGGDDARGGSLRGKVRGGGGSGHGAGAADTRASLPSAWPAAGAASAALAAWDWNLFSVMADVWERLLYSSLYPRTEPYARMGARPEFDAVSTLLAVLEGRARAGEHPRSMGAALNSALSGLSLGIEDARQRTYAAEGGAEAQGTNFR
ncbi:hypothetical protein T492DRAFT_912050 [Pavlovales sp. CCMP2436]|nr:hypothetical protein T492DRAFT_912050 [Pavlovales sp. CCMP2436]